VPDMPKARAYDEELAWWFTRERICGILQVFHSAIVIRNEARPAREGHWADQ